MDIVLIFNGLGNQMSQFAFYLAKKQHNPNSIFIYFPTKDDSQHNGFELEEVFNIKRHKSIKYYISYYVYRLYLTKDQINNKGKLIRKVLRVFKIQVIYENIRTHEFTPDLLLKSKVPTFFWGGWHNEKYFGHIRHELLRLYCFKIRRDDTRIIELQKEIRNKSSVSIHIRRGDYVSKRLINVFGNVCTLEYYNNAVKYIESKIDNPYFYIFSDDKHWIKENFKIPNSLVVDFNNGKDSWKDMFLISQCKHNINSNSTFSWWGAWLNGNPEKIVIVPDKFSLQDEFQEVYPDLWTKIPV